MPNVCSKMSQGAGGLLPGMHFSMPCKDASETARSSLPIWSWVPTRGLGGESAARLEQATESEALLQPDFRDAFECETFGNASAWNTCRLARGRRYSWFKPCPVATLTRIFLPYRDCSVTEPMNDPRFQAGRKQAARTRRSTGNPTCVALTTWRRTRYSKGEQPRFEQPA